MDYPKITIQSDSKQMPVCFFCRQTLDEFEHTGYEKHKPGQPYVVLSYEPCESCKARMSTGTTLIVVTEKQPADKRKPMQTHNHTNVYPTGQWCIIDPEIFSKMTGQPWKRGQICLIDQETYQTIKASGAPEK